MPLASLYKNSKKWKMLLKYWTWRFNYEPWKRYLPRLRFLLCQCHKDSSLVSVSACFFLTCDHPLADDNRLLNRFVCANWMRYILEFQHTHQYSQLYHQWRLQKSVFHLIYDQLQCDKALRCCRKMFLIFCEF